jgi:hypothetical protein
MSAMHPLAIVNAASSTSLVRMTLYHHSITVYHAPVERNEGVAVWGERPGTSLRRTPSAHSCTIFPARSKSEVGGTATCDAAARSDNHEQPYRIDGACSDSERKIPR